MARKFIKLQEVASLFNVSPDELSDMRSRGDIHGYRDGSTWKFKIEEVQRVASDRGIQISEAALAGEIPIAGESIGSSSVDDDLDALSRVEQIKPGESVLATEENLGMGPDEGASNTVIGRNDKLDSNSDSALKATIDSTDSGDDIELMPTDSDVLSGGSADLKMGDESVPPSGSGSKVEGMSGGLSTDMAGNVELADSDESDLQLADSSADVVQGGISDFDSSSISIDLEFDDDDLVLGSDTGSDVVINTGDDENLLSNPADTGLLISGDSLDLGGLGAESALELLGEEEMISLDESTVGPKSGASLGVDEDFLLTPVEDFSGEESDSGSQVIALDTDDSYEEDPANLMTEDDSAPITEAGDIGFSGGSTAAVGAPSITIPSVVTEVPYSIWNVLTLTTITCFLVLTGMFMYDLVRHMWSWEQPWSANSQMMDWILSLLE